MKKAFYLVLILFLFLYCGPKQEKIERYMEDGVEVIVNHLEPYKIKGEPSTLYLKEEFIIDTEREEIAETELTDAWAFDVNSEGDIYIFNPPSGKDNLVFKFDKNGKFITSFGRTGQGPGEVQYAAYQRITENDEIPIVDVRGHKLLIFNKDGDLIKEIRPDLRTFYAGSVVPLENGNYLIRRIQRDPSSDYENDFLCLYNSEFREIKVLDSQKIPNYWQNRIFLPPNKIYIWKTSKGKIYVGNDQRGYEIWVFDLEGNLLRKIKKEYKPVKVSEEYKKLLKKWISRPGSVVKSAAISKHCLPFRHFFTDDEGRLFVMTYEQEENQKEYVYDPLKQKEYAYDIFNAEGIFIGRKSLRLYFTPMQHWVTIKQNRLYCLREKESGYKELVVYKMRWE